MSKKITTTIIKKSKKKMKTIGKILRHKNSIREKKKITKKCMKNMILKIFLMIILFQMKKNNLQ
jgi:hypothetical protein